MTNTEQQAAIMLQSLRESVDAALDKKRRLGHTAVVWKNDQVVYLHPPEVVFVYPPENQQPADGSRDKKTTK